MVVKTSLKVLAVLVALYAGWWVFSFFSAWLGIGMIIATIIGVGAYFEKLFKANTKG